ncbi:hypothetical protein R3P38DRAFT_3252239 [Favolaschia claudopus]|uniref:F-box domain-containing protein n=1 Tax=Favolaschia claudopus TaxID=2862362 RepID=A0AAW0E4T7_9AGAR
MSMSMSIPSLSLPELWEVIIGFVDKDTDLKAISLVCQCFTSPAQRGLFHDIDLSVGTSKPHAIRLDAILRESPHLIPYIRTLGISNGHARCYEILAGISWTNVRRLTLYSPLFPEGNESPEHVKRLVRIPSLRSLEFYGSQKSLRYIVSVCSPNIDTLTLHCLDPSDDDESDADALPLSRPSIRDFSLAWLDSALPDFINDALDFTSLEILRWESHPPSDLHRFFTEYGSTVRKIDMGITFESEQWASFDIALYFPCLKLITIRHVISSHTTSMLKRLPLDNGIEEIEFDWSLREPTSDDDVREFETAVLQSLPALCRVKFVVNPSTWKEPNVQRRFPTRKSLLDDRREVFPRLAREKDGGLIEVWFGQIKVE